MQAATRRAQNIEPPEYTQASQHLVQFYDADPGAWVKSVGAYVCEGLKQGEAVLIIATPEHKRTISRQLKLGATWDRQSTTAASLSVTPGKNSPSSW